MKNSLMAAVLAVVAVVSLAQIAEARPDRVAQVPNNMLSCGLCHTNGTGGPRNSFGADVEATLTEPGPAGQVQWEALFELDSDGDGCTNGQELADPNGTWRTGDPNPEGDVTNPADPDASQDCSGGGDTSNGTTSNGTTSNGTTSNGTTSNGTTDDGSTDDGGSDSDGGCSTSPKSPTSAGALGILLGLLGMVTFRRRV
ncbi:MAG: MYXO-CTERM sorting domain-containing protein [Myxococcota bacterium]